MTSKSQLIRFKPLSRLLVILTLFYCFGTSLGRTHRYESNVDFLLHEAGNPGQNSQIDKYKADFPPLVTPPSKTSQSTVQQWPPLKPISTPGLHFSTSPVNTNSKRDFVSPNKSTTKPMSSIPQDQENKQTPAPQDSNGKRNYVAPNWPTLRPVSTPHNKENQQPKSEPDTKHKHGNVKDLINFYNENDKISSSHKGFSVTTPMSTKIQSMPSTTKPLSFSDVVAGDNKPVTPKVSTQRPSGSTGGFILPSSIVNKNKQGNSIKVTDNELQTLSEELIRKDVNNAAKYITINYQGKTSAGSKDDKAPLPLLRISDNVWNIPTIQKFIPLLDNYERDSLINEYVTPQEKNEENAFMDAIMSTQVIRHLMNFFKEKGYVTPDPRQQRDFLKQLWFNLYSRGKGKIGSSGFEHVFVSELKNGEVSGLHNWIYFGKEEAANKINYLGYLKYSQFNDKGAVLKFHFNQQGTDKPVNSLFIGTSPELEMALYTLCFITRADEDCKLRLAGKDVNIVTYKFRYRSKNLIGSAYPQI